MTTTTLLDFVSATPAPLTRPLVALAPLIHRVRRLADVFCWSAPWEESVLLIALWWSLVLFADLTLQFFLPLAVLFVLALGHWSATATPLPSPPTTEATLVTLIDDLAVLHALVPDTSLPAPSLRITALFYLPYLALTCLVPLRICIAVSGTLVLVHHARWARNARAALARSAHLRWAYYHIYALLSGTPLPAPPPEYSSRPASGVTEYTDAPDSDTPLRFLFTVYENQRWWVGLDWTAALLPGERPSWCSASQQPLPPPATFSLPSPTTSFVPVGKHGRAKRLARWTWEEPEWRVVVRKQGHDGLWRVEKTPPKDTDDARASRSSDPSGSGPSENPDPSIIPSHEDDIVTDPDGWVYGDNKWEGASSKGGMGKYTRYRRWTRIAILTETIELVGPGEFGVVRDSGTFSVSTTASMATAAVASPTASNFSDWESTGSAPDVQRESTGPRSILRQRLKAVMDGSGH